MKKTILLVLALGIYTISLGQDTNKTTLVETKYQGDSTLTIKTTTTIVDGKPKTDTEVIVEKTIYYDDSKVSTDEPTQKKKKTRGIMGLSFVGSFLNNNEINSKLGMRDINDFNFGMLFQFGVVTKFGMEFTFDIGFEGNNNESNNKQLDVFSSYYSLNAGYPIIKLKNERFMVVPRVGIGFNTDVYNYVKTSDNNLTMDSIAGNAWSINQGNFYIPLGLELRFGKPTSYFVVAGEYRYTFSYGNAYLAGSKQRVSDFPELGLNNVGIRLGFVRIF